MECAKYSFTNDAIVTKSYGDNLFNQYEILLRTLSFLNIDDLTKAALVCKSWNQVVHHIYRRRDKTNRFRWHTRSAQSCSLRETCFNDGIFFRSLSVIGFELSRYKHWLWKELLTPKFNITDYDESEFVVPGVRSGVFSVVADVVIAPNNEGMLKHSRNQATAVFFPEIDGFNVKTVQISQYSNMMSVAETLLRDDDQPLKGLLIFDKRTDREENIEQKLFDALVDAGPSQPFAIAGGLFSKVAKFDKIKWVNDFDAVLYGFYGSNVECYADVLQSQRSVDVEKFMKTTMKNLPPIDPSKQQRIAFIIRCVGRENGHLETELFFKYFPDTPAFVLQSFGEFGYRTNTGKHCPEKKMRMGKVEIDYTFSSVFFFFTINLPS